jgi:hypothetical protein
MIADARFDACLAGPPLNHTVAVLLRHAVRPARETPGGAKRRAVLVVPDPGRGDVRVEIRFQLGHTRRFVLLATLFVQAHPSAPSLAEVIPNLPLADVLKNVAANVDAHGAPNGGAKPQQREQNIPG